MNGTLTCRPLFHVSRYEPKRSTMAASACGTILMHVTENSTTSTTITMMAIRSGSRVIMLGHLPFDDELHALLPTMRTTAPWGMNEPSAERAAQSCGCRFPRVR